MGKSLAARSVAAKTLAARLAKAAKAQKPATDMTAEREQIRVTGYVVIPISGFKSPPTNLISMYTKKYGGNNFNKVLMTVPERPILDFKRRKPHRRVFTDADIREEFPVGTAGGNPSLLQSALDNLIALKNTAALVLQKHTFDIPAMLLTQGLPLDQDLHADKPVGRGDKKRYLSGEAPSMIGLVALQKNTFLKVCPGSHRVLLGIEKKKCSPVRVHIPVGHAILFDSHLVHAGVGFVKPNLRLHVYFPHVDEASLPHNKIAVVSKHLLPYFE